MSATITIRIAVFYSLALLFTGCASLQNPVPPEGTRIQDFLSDQSPGPVMIVLPTGRFTMGSPETEHLRFPHEGPQHTVTITTRFAISQYEVSFAEYDRFAAATNTTKPDDKGWGMKKWGRGKMPVFNVNWYEAKNYARWLSEETGHHYRLPTEAEWEYAARAGTQTPWNTGDCIDTGQANYHGGYRQEGCNNTGLYPGKTIATGLLPPNLWGLHDMHGNVLEWTEDCWHQSYKGAPHDEMAWTETSNVSGNGQNPADCQRRVLRGGSWSGRPRDIRSAARARNLATFKSIFIGFRLVREL